MSRSNSFYLVVVVSERSRFPEDELVESPVGEGHPTSSVHPPHTNGLELFLELADIFSVNEVFVMIDGISRHNYNFDAPRE